MIMKTLHAYIGHSLIQAWTFAYKVKSGCVVLVCYALLVKVLAF